MKRFRIKKVIANGLLLAVPLGTVIYIFIKLIGVLAHVIAPLAANFGIQKILGELTLTILSVFLLILLILGLGLLMQIKSVEGFGKKLEDIAYRLFPSLNQIKVMASEKLNFSNQSSGWQPVLL